MGPLLLVIALAGMLPPGISAGSYRRPVLAMGTASVQPNLTVFGLLSDCFNVPLFDLCTEENIGTLTDCLYNPVNVPGDCASMNVTITSTFTLLDGSTLAVRS